LAICPIFISSNAELAACLTSSLRSLRSRQLRSKSRRVWIAKADNYASDPHIHAGDGSSSIEIAKSIGSTPASVRKKCCQYKIKIRRGHRSMKNAPVHPLSYESIVAHLPASLSVEFHREAEQLQIPASILASRLLAAIVDSNIYEAVLDDKD
jgi:hypothetical protein